MNNRTYPDFIKYLNKYGVNYCIVGAEAVMNYTRARYSKDIDFFISSDRENAEKILRAVKNFFNDSLGLKKEDFTKSGQIIQLGFEPNRIDIITGFNGLTEKQEENILNNKISGKFGTEPTFFASLNDMIMLKELAVNSKNKRASDEEDLKYLKEAKEKRR
ncbi:MAG: nucleotidyltransferase [Elusimicrobiota bacterium]|nr:nucleotidyltransferase [Elusimicrobiota bacterium]